MDIFENIEKKERALLVSVDLGDGDAEALLCELEAVVKHRTFTRKRNRRTAFRPSR